jgi:hypothetical protein
MRKNRLRERENTFLDYLGFGCFCVFFWWMMGMFDDMDWSFFGGGDE